MVAETKCVGGGSYRAPTLATPPWQLKTRLLQQMLQAVWKPHFFSIFLLSASPKTIIKKRVEKKSFFSFLSEISGKVGIIKRFFSESIFVIENPVILQEITWFFEKKSRKFSFFQFFYQKFPGKLE